jgi:hypothetical protein
MPALLWPENLEPGYAAIRAAARCLSLDDQLKEECRIVIAGGTPGTGKSQAAAFFVDGRLYDYSVTPARLFVEDDGNDTSNALFLNASRLDGYGKDVDELEAKCRNIFALALDDVGMGKSSSGVAATRIEALLCERHDAGLYTFVTTNLPPSTFWPIYGGPEGRLADRVAGDPVGWVDCLEPSRRRARKGTTR